MTTTSIPKNLRILNLLLGFIFSGLCIVNPAHCDEVYGINYSEKLTLQAAVDNCEIIVVAKYLGFKNSKRISYYCPPTAFFQTKKILKGKTIEGKFRIRFEFNDKTDNQKPKGWQFSSSLMPQKRSKWILFIPNLIPINNQYEAYYGSFGRIPYNQENLQKIQSLLKAKPSSKDSLSTIEGPRDLDLFKVEPVVLSEERWYSQPHATPNTFRYDSYSRTLVKDRY